MDALEGLLMAAVIFSIAVLASALVRMIALLVIALVSLKGTQPADRPAILRALAVLAHRGERRVPQLASAGPRRAIRRRD